MPNARSRPWLALVGFILLSAVVSAIGGGVTAGSVKTWFPTLIKPSWNPPSQLFAPVWTLLYGLMAVAAWRVWCRRDRPGAKSVLWVYGVQLALNATWSVLFFGLRNPGLALIEIILFLGVLLWLQTALWRLDRVAGMLWIPYVLWVSFATALNAAIWHLN
ncbi:MAG: tryptophan-rich sensory protein [Opitutaceae bacterium]|nr:tryptophan-rich sensory protein [Opitutaceae bacterium]